MTAHQSSDHVDGPIGSDDAIVVQALSRAEALLRAALAQQTVPEKQEAAKLGRMMNDPAGKAFTFAMVDEVFRSHTPSKTAASLRRVVEQFGAPQYMPWTDRLLIQAGAFASRFLPGLVTRGVAKRMQQDSARVILPGEAGPLHQYLTQRSQDGFRLNLNHLGEAVLGEQEAKHRMDAILSHLADPAVSYISVKISAIFSQINLVAWEDSLLTICDRLRILYREGLKRGKFVNLDMEEYRDLALTLAAFQSLLDEPEFHRYSAGIVLQAYLPDAWDAQRTLTAWAQRRVQNGGAPIKIRLVKGANLAMEAVEAELHGWHAAPYASKHETDANFRRMMEYGCRPEHAAAVRLGVASHNLFDVALALTLREANQVESSVEIEMLEGMANHQARAVRDDAKGLLLYAPAVKQEDFLSAMAYLVRRLDENTSPENFLKDMFAIRPGSPEWEYQKKRFLDGWKSRNDVSDRSRRLAVAIDASHSVPFLNEPDTDWSQPRHREELARYSDWSPSARPSLPSLDAMLDAAVGSQASWEGIGFEARGAVMNRLAEIMSRDRFQTLQALRVEGKKAIPDGDGEVSEAIDFARYYARHALPPAGAHSQPLGVVAVVSPWNFPYAIPAGGVIAALMAGNSVVLKPAPATVGIAWHLANQLWEAGVPRDVLHFYPCSNAQGEAFLTDERIHAIVLTGSYETAKLFHGWRPSIPLYAETSGKNALIVTAHADRDLAIKDLVRSAFGHSGQKCSAASLAILEGEVYDDEGFRRQLQDAARSLEVGPTSRWQSVVTPFVLPTAEKLHRALTTLDEGETWLLEPKQHPDAPNLWSPGIKLGVKPGSWFHQTECFGPVLGLMRAEDLDAAIAMQNGTDYGLTAGIHTLNQEEIHYWKERVQAGNLYINRPITGAIVQRQPFGGWKKSCVGPGAKAGGPNYVWLFRQFVDPSEFSGASEVDYEQAWREHFSMEQDPSGLRCESNVFRYRPSRGVVLRLAQRDLKTLERARLAAKVARVPLEISIREEETDEAFAKRLPVLAKRAEFLRTIDIPAGEILRIAFDAGLQWIHGPLVSAGRIELTRWVREQSVSQTLHRYGQLPTKG
ncbi:bifunctional proline dehydrogenase/L-glutamate gamma-semialdehyde dehydrogenase [Pirellulaceae bacterium SH467]